MTWNVNISGSAAVNPASGDFEIDALGVAPAGAPRIVLTASVIGSLACISDALHEGAVVGATEDDLVKAQSTVNEHQNAGDDDEGTKADPPYCDHESSDRQGKACFFG